MIYYNSNVCTSLLNARCTNAITANHFETLHCNLRYNLTCTSLEICKTCHLNAACNHCEKANWLFNHSFGIYQWENNKHDINISTDFSTFLNADCWNDRNGHKRIYKNWTNMVFCQKMKIGDTKGEIGSMYCFYLAPLLKHWATTSR